MRPIAIALLLLSAACGERVMIQNSTPTRTPAQATQATLETATFALG